MKNRSLAFSYLFVFLVFLLTACSPDRGEKTASKALDASGDIFVGAVYPKTQRGKEFIKSINLAVEEVNKNGKILDRDVKVIFKDDEFFVNKSIKIAKQFVSNHNIVAVLGHSNSETAINSSLIYEQNKLVFITESATSNQLTSPNLNYVFRNINTETLFAKYLAAFAISSKIKKVLVLYVNTNYGKNLSNEFQIFARESCINIAGAIPFKSLKLGDDRLKTDASIRNEFLSHANLIVNNEYNKAFDAIFIAASNPFAAKLVKIVRELGITCKILGSEGLDTPDLIEIAGKNAEGVVVCTFALPKSEKAEQFKKKYYDKYSVNPEGWGALAYDSINLLAHCMRSSGSTVPTIVTDCLHNLSELEGVTGLYKFDSKGNLMTSKPFVFKTVRNGKFENLDDFQYEYTIEDWYDMYDLGDWPNREDCD